MPEESHEHHRITDIDGTCGLRHQRLEEKIDGLCVSMQEVRDAMLGTFEKRGLITEVKDGHEDHTKRINLLELWIKEKESMLKMGVLKLVSALFMAVISGGGMVYVMQYLAGGK